MRGGVARRGGPTNRPSPGGSSSRPMVARPVRYGPVRQKTNFPLRTSQSQPHTGHITHARTGPDTQRAQAHNHTQNSNSRTHPRQTSHSHAHTHLPNGERCPSTDDTAPHHSHSHSATPTRGIRKPPCSEFPHNVTTPLSTTPKWPPHTTYTPGRARCCIKTVSRDNLFFTARAREKHVTETGRRPHH